MKHLSVRHESPLSPCSTPWTRREFLAGALASAAAVELGLASRLPSSSFSSPSMRKTGSRSYAYVARSGHDLATETGSIEVFSILKAGWSKIQGVQTPSPSALVLSRCERYLYVANAVKQYLALPRGTIQAFVIDPPTGKLSLLGTQPLSLAATCPTSLALSRDGKTLAAASHHAGIFNLFAIANDGMLERSTGIYKSLNREAGISSSPSMKNCSLAFGSSGRTLLSFHLRDSVDIFAVENDRFIRKIRWSDPRGLDIAAFAVHPEIPVFYSLSAQDKSLNIHRYGSKAPELIQQASLPVDPLSVMPGRAESSAVAVHPSGRWMYTAGQGRIHIWPVDLRTGQVGKPAWAPSPDAVTGMLHHCFSQADVLYLQTASDTLWQVKLCSLTGRPFSPVRVAQIPNLSSLVAVSKGDHA